MLPPSGERYQYESLEPDDFPDMENIPNTVVRPLTPDQVAARNKHIKVFSAIGAGVLLFSSIAINEAIKINKANKAADAPSSGPLLSTETATSTITSIVTATETNTP